MYLYTSQSIYFIPIKRGRPPTRYIKVIQNDLNKNKIKINISQKHGTAELEQLTEDRDKCKLALTKAPIRSKSSKEEEFI